MNHRPDSRPAPASLVRGALALTLITALAILISRSSRTPDRLTHLAEPPAVEAPAGALTPAPIPAPAPAQETRRQQIGSETIQVLVEKLGTAPLEDLWKIVDHLKKAGKEVVPDLLRHLEKSEGQKRLGCARALLHLGDIDTRERALDALVTIIRKSDNLPLRDAALDTLVEEGEPEDVLEFLTGLFEKATLPEDVIPLARALIDLDNDPEAQKKLEDYLESRDPEVQKSAALVLAEAGLIDHRVRGILIELRREPSARGKLARVLYRNDQLIRQIEEGERLPGTDAEKLLERSQDKIRALEAKIEVIQNRSPGKGHYSIPELAVLEEIIRQIDRTYVDPSLVDHTDLIVAAAKGMVESLDRFSAFLPPTDASAFKAEMSGEYCGIGAHVIKRDPHSPLEITKPIYGGPAYEAGLLTGDRILEIDGIPTVERSPTDTVTLLKGPENSEIKLRVFRRGWTEPRDITFRRRTVNVPTVTFHLLPHRIGLLKLTQFGEKSYEEFKAALDDLVEEDMDGLIVDLRNNLGGYLPTAQKITNLFVGKQDRPMLTVKGRNDLPGHEDQTFTDDNHRFDDFPLVILINERSASASEIVAGALKDFHRAMVVGKKSYGKGTVQNLYPLSEQSEALLGGESTLKLTHKQYFLPSGRSIHTLRDKNGKVIQKGGVSPHLMIEPRKFPIWFLDEIEELRSSEELKAYAVDHFEKLLPLLLAGDGGEVERYPGLREVFEKMDTRADLDAARRVVRYHLRRKYEDEKGKELAGDFQDDLQLQAGILEVLKQLEKNPADLVEYAKLRPVEESQEQQSEKK